METQNLFIKETYVNETEGYLCGDSDWFETYYTNKHQAFKSLRKQYGAPHKMYIDTKSGAKQIGWIFS